MLRQVSTLGARPLRRASEWRGIGPNSSRKKFFALSSYSGNPHTTSDQWELKMLYDGECPLCLREVDMLRKRNTQYQSIKFVDISADEYSPHQNAGIDYEAAMGRVHVISNDGKVFTNVEAFKKLYEAVGLGWVYAITNYEPFSTIANALYNVWAKYRLPITGRPPLDEVLKNKNNSLNCDKNCKK
ncbi:uncharacterized protein At5g50100, chloroplastic [Selaginella moellendorffii]|uniref:uncharacterized protein At5g50100, chloroplastic n=1 Tax=Selaginella moellendorffii TaxID=88036 RepID=UPI000D1C22DA|nr:uncharacterized protein At5g50100, chloroplastic [Selaginella moellendorffii]|eukprot:XP_002972437.2 uncharacterized protein At5g50100, chloroplastic [Selaginella moellendorffii]